ncbi:MAG: sulfotransferase family 2 domain-containing protein [Reichenbachiella sp.]|uniref:sulfotransferase family 2 domain-containing protein n=1 Tax=Reichenbachiella sp. TaxID=2184521 RepID=UPI003267897E
MIRTVRKNNRLSTKLNLKTRIRQTLIRFSLNLDSDLISQDNYNLTICDKPKFIWFRVAKVCTRSIFDHLKNSGLDLDAEQAMCVHYSPAMYSEYFKFAFVRNPWSRLVSCWKNKVVESNYFKFSSNELAKMQQFENFVKYVATLDIERCDHHLRLQSKLIDLNNVDFVGRFENFEQDFKHVQEVLKMEPMSIPHLNRSGANNQVYYTDDLKGRVAEIYKKDINLFSYKFE